MAVDIRSLKKKYVDSCRNQRTSPNTAILSAFFKAEIKKANNDVTSLVLLLDDLKSVDFHPLYDVFMAIDISEVDAVDIFQKSSCSMDGDHILLLLHTIKQKLRIVDLQDRTIGKNFLMDLSLRGLTCKVLTLRFSHFRNLNMFGEFMQLHTLNLDFSPSLTNIREDCFACMPKLKCLSLCGTRVANIWTTSASLVKLPYLVELRFQSCVCCHDTSPCPRSSIGKSDIHNMEEGHHVGMPSLAAEETTNLFSDMEVDLHTFTPNSYDVTYDLSSVSADSSDGSDVDFSHFQRGINLEEQLSYPPSMWNGLFDPQNKPAFSAAWAMEDEEESWPTWGIKDEEESWTSSYSRHISHDSPEKPFSYHHPSPICYEKHYREYMIASLPRLRTLDNMLIRKCDKERATDVVSEHFEFLPYRRTNKESIISILHRREIKASGAHMQDKSQYSYSRSVCAAKVGNSAWPFLRSLSVLGITLRNEKRKLRPRQFEYHPSNSSLMVIGTLDGEVVVVNHEIEKIVRYVPSLGAMNSVLGLCWLKKYPSKLISGSDNGSLKLYDIQHMPPTAAALYPNAGSVTFEDFDQLTSVHVNSTDELFVASGYSKHVALYDIGSGKCLQLFTDMHQEHINVVKFANHSPSMFATSSFDHDVKMWDLRQKPIHPCYTASSSRGNVMVCFSPDDHYLLASAVDNEVKQLLAVDGRLHLDFDILPTGSSQNFTRSYYMNGRDYIVSGSCDEHVVRICCAQTGRRLRDISLEGQGSGCSMFVQSLRGDPFRDFSLSILAAYLSPSSNPEIVKVNMLSSRDTNEKYSRDQHFPSADNLGGG